MPCIVFFDEIDALVPKRSSELHEASTRVVNTLLTELDGLGAREGIYIIAATNRPDMIDEAMLRPGRLETCLYIELPNAEGRVEILRALLRQKPMLKPELAQFGARDECTGFSGADLGALIRRAGQQAIRRNSDEVKEIDFVEAAKKIRPSVEDAGKYEKLKEKLEGMEW